jgi:hypothetical protein
MQNCSRSGGVSRLHASQLTFLHGTLVRLVAGPVSDMVVSRQRLFQGLCAQWSAFDARPHSQSRLEDLALRPANWERQLPSGHWFPGKKGVGLSIHLIEQRAN